MLAPELNFIAATFARAEVEREVAIVEETSMIQLSQQFGGGADEEVGGGGRGSTEEEDEDRLACEGWLLPPLANASKQFRVGEHRRRHHELEALTNDLPAMITHIIRAALSTTTNDGIGGGEEVDACVSSSPPVLSHSWKDMYRASKDITDEAYVTSKGLKAEDLASCRGAFFDPVLLEHGSGGTSGSTLPSSTTTTSLPPWVPPHTFFSDSAPHTKIFKLGDEKKWFSSSSGVVGGEGGGGAPRDVLAELEALLYQDDHLESLEKEQLIYGNNGGSKVGYTEAKQSTIGPVRGRNVRQESPGTAALLATAKHASPTHPSKSSHKKFFSKSGSVRSPSSSSTAGVKGVAKKAPSAGNVEEDDGEGEEEEDHQAVPQGIRSELYKATRRWECLFLIWSKWVVQQVLQFQQPSSNPAAASSTSSTSTTIEGVEEALNAAVKEAIHSVDIVSFIRGYFNTIVHERVFHVLSAIVRPEASLSSIRPGSSFTATTTTTFDGAAAASSLKMVSSSSGRRYTSPPPPSGTSTTPTSSKPTANDTTTISSPSSPTTSKPFGVPPNKGIVIVKGKQRSIRTLTSIEARIVHEEDSWLLSAGYDATFLHTGSVAASDRSDAVDLLRSNSSTKWRALGDEESSGSGSASCHRGIIAMQSYIRRRLATRRYQSILLSTGGGSSSSAGGGSSFTRLSTASKRLGATVLKHFNKQQSLQRAYVQSCIDVARDTAMCEKFYDSEEDVFKKQFKQYMAKATDHYLNSVPLDVDWTVEKTSVPATVPSSSDAIGGGSEGNHRVEIRYVNLRSGRSQTENPNMLKVAALKQRELARVTRRREEVYKDMGLFVQKLNVRKVDLEKLERDMGSAI